MREIKRIVLHCTSGWPNQTTESIKNYWKNNLGWKNVGYHKLISADGTIEDLAPLSTVTNGVAGYNSDSVHICYKGGLKEITKEGKYIYGDARTPAQVDAFYTAIKQVFDWLSMENKKARDKGLKEPYKLCDITILGHRDLSKDLNGNGKIETREWVKVCPTFNAIEEYGWIAGHKGLERMKDRKTY